MSLTAWIVFLLAAAAGGGFAAFLYRTREPAVRHRALLIGLRTLALAVLLLVIFDPALPATGGAAPQTAIALDGSLSMRLPRSAGDTTSRWSEAVARARSAAGDDAPVLLFGDAVRSLGSDDLAAAAPEAAHSRLLPAVRAAAEAGARRLLVVSDGGIEDGVDVVRWAARYGIALDVERIGDGRPAARAIAELEAPAWVEAGEPVPVRVALGAGERPAALTLRAPGAEPVRVEVPAGEPGRLQTTELAITPEAPTEGGVVRLDVALDEPAGAERSVYVQIGGEPAGVALVSLRPDWEPRFLAPVLETALGLPVRGFLRAADGAWVRLGRGGDAGTRATEEDVRRAVAAAELLVLHGVGGDAPDWLRTAGERAGRLLVFPGEGGAPGVPVQLGEAAPDEYYLVPEVPSSPVAPLLSGLPLEGLAPLTELRRATAVEGAWAPLHVSRRRRGEPEPVALAGESAGRRWVVALGAGYWGWAFRDDAGRTLYARLWGALAGWLLREEGAVAAAAVRPAARSVPRGQAPAWVTPGIAADSVRIELSAPGLDSARVSMVRATGADTLRSTPAPPGHYSYSATAFAGDSIAGSASGPLTVESYSPELAREAVDLDALQAQATPVGPGAAERGPRRPLRASALPWVLLIALLSAEWILRRRWGLR